MVPLTVSDHQKLLTSVIQKQIIILGPSITLAKARNVPGLTVADDGTVVSMSGNPQELTQKLVEQFMELSGLIVKKTMEPLLASYQPGGNASQVQTVVVNAPTPVPIAPPTPAVNPTGGQTT